MRFDANEREDPDGALELRPDPPIAAARRRLGLVPATQAEFEAEHGPLPPPDDEP